MTSKGASESGQVVYRPTDTGRAPTGQDGDDHQQSSTPPPYSGPSRPSLPRPAASVTYPGLPVLNYALYCPPQFKLSPDETTITTYKHEPNVYPAVLSSLVQSQSTVPPKVQIHVRGMSAGGVVDFHIKLNMMSLFVGDNAPKERWNYLKVVEDGEMAWRGDLKQSTQPRVTGGIDEWVRRYCADSSAIKQFTLERIVANWDTEYIQGRLLSLIASTAYRGKVETTFPVTHSTVVVHSPDRVNRLFTNVTSLFTGTKKYAVVKAVWPYASVPPDAANRTFAVQSEESWWNDWKDAIRHAVLSRRQGWVTVEDRLEFLMAPRGDGGKVEPWGTNV